MASLRQVPLRKDDMDTKTREHVWREIRMTPVFLIQDDDGNPIAVEDPTQESQIQVGCLTCNMGMDEGAGVACPGQDLFGDD